MLICVSSVYVLLICLWTNMLFKLLCFSHFPAHILDLNTASGEFFVSPCKLLLSCIDHKLIISAASSLIIDQMFMRNAGCVLAMCYSVSLQYVFAVCIIGKVLLSVLWVLI